MDIFNKRKKQLEHDKEHIFENIEKTYQTIPSEYSSNKSIENIKLQKEKERQDYINKTKRMIENLELEDIEKLYEIIKEYKLYNMIKNSTLNHLSYDYNEIVKQKIEKNYKI